MDHNKTITDIASDAAVLELADVTHKRLVENSNKLIVFIPQIHHHLQASNSHKITEEDINKLQEKIYKLLELLNTKEIGILGVEDVTEEDNKEMSLEELLEKTEGEEARQLTTWHYEKRFPTHFKTMNIDTPNLFGMRSAMLFAAQMLLQKKEHLKKEEKAALTYLQQELDHITEEQKTQNYSAMCQHKEAHPDIQMASFVLEYFNALFPGFNTQLSNLFVASEVAAYTEELGDETDQGEEDESATRIHEATQKLHHQFGQHLSSVTSYDDCAKQYISLIKDLYRNAQKQCERIDYIFTDLRSRKAIETTLTVMERENDDSLIAVFGAAHIPAMENEATKKGLSSITLTPKSELWKITQKI